MARRQHRIDAIISYQAQTENPDRDEEGLDMGRVISDTALLAVLTSSLTVLLIVCMAVVR